MKISVHNLGPIKKASIEVGGLTVFVGPNGTGKSYLAKVLYGLQRVNTLISYVSSHQQSLHEVIFDMPVANMQEFLDGLQRLTPYELQNRIPIIANNYARFFVTTLGDYFNDDSGLFTETSIEYELITPLREEQLSQIIDRAIEEAKIAVARADEDIEWHSLSLYYQLFDAYGGGWADYFPAARSNFMLTYKSLYRARADEHVGLESIADKLLLASKGNSTRKTGTLTRFDRPTEDFVSNLYDLDSSETSALANIATKLQEQLYGSGHMLIEQPEGTLPDFRYKVENADNKIRLHLASSMVTETSPLLIGFKHWVRPDSLVIIDEPESHLHPEAQRALVNVLSDAVSQDTNIIIITHSPYILSCVNNLIKYGSLVSKFPDDDNVKKLQSEHRDMVALKPDDVRAYHFGRDGLVKDIVLESGLIDEAEFTEPFNDINDIYETMRDIEWEHQA